MFTGGNLGDGGVFTHMLEEGKKQYRAFGQEQGDAQGKWDTHKWRKDRDEGSQCSGKDMRPEHQEEEGNK